MERTIDDYEAGIVLMEDLYQAIIWVYENHIVNELDDVHPKDALLILHDLKRYAKVVEWLLMQLHSELDNLSKGVSK